ncbi:hypothetical protein SAMN04487911_104113 [Arenibacter nanhaiticus]|uniref:Uncharacterized protein n=1 Tax=Arenibacter nanhaiticus TaxID=558155 RepID=A0A1M6CZM0_9FLAO|nr:hypothetical protein [Arenibacter nanhaiticus]SHI66446.1 hypothetical protein SAMN04487911_104113 [Arenibacter nanhaiticus]
MRKTFLYLLLFLWIFSIFTPYVISLVNGESVVVMTNITEEENHPKGKQDMGEKLLVTHANGNYFLSLFEKKPNNQTAYQWGTSNFIMDIALPPPELLS